MILPDEDEHQSTSVDSILDTERFEREVGIARADDALRQLERLTLDEGYDPTRPGTLLPNVVSRLRRLLIACGG